VNNTARNKITVIGGTSGVGFALVSNLSFACDSEMFSESEECQIIALGQTPVKSQGVGSDLDHGTIHSRVLGSHNKQDIAGSRVIVVTAGIPRGPGQTRDDVAKLNAPLIWEYGQDIKELAPDAMVIVVTNPSNAMATIMKESTGFPSHRVVGFGEAVDTARCQGLVADALALPSKKAVYAPVFGEHGEDMVVPWSLTTIYGSSVNQHLSEAVLADIEQRTIDMGKVLIQQTGASSKAGPGPHIARAVVALMGGKSLSSVYSVAAHHQDGHILPLDVCLGQPVLITEKGFLPQAFRLSLAESHKLSNTQQKIARDVTMLKQSMGLLEFDYA